MRRETRHKKQEVRTKREGKGERKDKGLDLGRSGGGSGILAVRGFHGGKDLWRSPISRAEQKFGSLARGLRELESRTCRFLDSLSAIGYIYHVFWRKGRFLTNFAEFLEKDAPEVSVKINISNLSQGTHQYDLSKSAPDLGLPENFSGDVSATVTLEKSSRQILLKADLRAKGMFHCDRCLEEFRRDLTTSLQTLYVWDAEDRSGDDDGDVRVLGADANIIDLSGDARDVLLLAVPLKLLCKDDCAGLCRRCGKNLNTVADGECDCAPEETDPRWNKLAGLLEVSMLKKRN